MYRQRSYVFPEQCCSRCSRLLFSFSLSVVRLVVAVRRAAQKTAAVEQMTSVTPRDRPRSHMVPQPGNFALPIQTTVTPRKRPSASNPQTPVTGTV